MRLRSAGLSLLLILGMLLTPLAAETFSGSCQAIFS